MKRNGSSQIVIKCNIEKAGRQVMHATKDDRNVGQAKVEFSTLLNGIAIVDQVELSSFLHHINLMYI
jgi:hypothetical protein